MVLDEFLSLSVSDAETHIGLMLRNGEFRKMDDYRTAYWKKHGEKLGSANVESRAYTQEPQEAATLRSFIKACASVFVVLGVIGFAIAATVTLFILTRDQASGRLGAAVMTLLVGTVSAAGIVLTGGTCYLLASIDERIQRLSAPPPA